MYSLYFAIMTITSVGYGDVGATLYNVPEQIVCSLIMFATALLWGYLVGVFCTVAAASPATQAFRDELSQLNSFMTEHNLPSELRFRLREFLVRPLQTHACPRCGRRLIPRPSRAPAARDCPLA